MSIDPTTVMASAAMATALVAFLFGVTTLQRHDDRPNRFVSASFLAHFVGIASVPTLGTLDSTDMSIRSLAIGLTTAGVGAGAAALWCATQGFAGRTPTTASATTGVVVAAALGIVASRVDPRWELMPVAILLAVFHTYAVRELRRGPMASNLNSKLLELILGVSAIATMAVVLLGAFSFVEADAVWASLTGIVAAICIAAAVCLVALRVERYGNWWTLGEDQDRSELGVHENDVLLSEARDRIDRCRTAAQPVHVITTALPGLHELNLAYGHLAGDAALRWVAELLRRQAPPSAVLGHMGAGNFVIVTSRDPELVANSIQNGMMRVPPPASLPVRLTPVFAWSSSDEAGYDFAALRRVAQERMSRVS